jgi:ferrous-iron efflux pump FieF
MTCFKDNDLIKSASYASVIVAFVIMLIKSYGWFSTESQSMLASLIDSLLDISSSFINLIAIRIAFAPPDYNHRFGHGKFQDLAIFSQSIFFLISCFFTMFSSVKALYLKDIPHDVEFGTDVMYLCIFLTFALVLYQSFVIKRTGSRIIAADKLHYFSDFLTNIAVVFSLYLSSSFWYVDALIGIAISLFILYSSYKLFREAVRNLSDEEFADQDREKILQIISTFPQAKGVHELKTRSAGDKPFIQFHLEIDGKLSLFEAHAILDEIVVELMNYFPKAEIIIHQDPV